MKTKSVKVLGRCWGLLSIIVVLSAYSISAVAQSRLKVHTDFIELGKRDKLFQPFFYQSDTSLKVRLDIHCFKFAGEDSLLVYSKWNEVLKLKKGARRLKVKYAESDTNSYLLPTFGEIIQKVDIVPPGFYKLYVKVTSTDTVLSYCIQRNVDSGLSQRSSLKKMVDNTLQPRSKKSMPIKLSGSTERLRGIKSDKLSLARSQRKLDKLLKKDKIRSVPFDNNGAQNIDLFYSDWFIGRYFAVKETDGADADQIRKMDNSLEDYKSLFSQTREIKKEKKENKRVDGQITLSTNLSTGQEEQSEIDNNFYELGGVINLPVAGIPISVEGLYTSQDRTRKIKTSYIRFRYDADKAKEELFGTVTAYKQKFSETQTKGKGIQQVYSAYLAQLVAKKQQLLNDAKQNPKLTANDSLSGKYTDAQSKLAELRETEKKIEKYQALLNQYSNTLYFDSVMAYDKIKDLENAEGLSYKQLAKKADHILPEGKAKNFLAGLTGLEAGIFPKYISKYTASGQTVKGVDVGYDFGFFQAGFTTGGTEFISRSGDVDKYTNYSGRLIFTPYKKQNVSLVYYGYMPNRKMLESDVFFDKVDVALPGFKQPVHIVSVVYDADVAKFLRINSEIATSFKEKNISLSEILANDRLAYSFTANADIPKTDYSLEAGYEHTGKNFQNDVMPISSSGLDRYHGGVRTSFFRSFLGVGVEYNYIMQHNFSSTASNTRWGFDLKTTSKRYPSLLLSYKPFSTFRSYDDTFAIQQKPIIGEVWTGRVSYQVKRMQNSLRTQMLYNRNKGIADTAAYGGSTLQFTGIGTTPSTDLTLTVGYSKIETNNQDVLSPVHQSTRFANVLVGYAVTPDLRLCLGQNVAIADFGLARYCALTGTEYRHKKLPVGIRANIKYNTYRLGGTAPWKHIFGGNIDLIWRIDFSILSKTTQI